MSSARQRYYLAHRDQLLNRRRANYNSEDAKAYYESNRDRIRATQKLYHIKKTEGECLTRITNLIRIADPALHPFLNRLLANCTLLTSNEISGLEKSILFAGRKPEEPVIGASDQITADDSY